MGIGTIGAAWADTLIDATESGTSDAVNVQGHEVALGSVSTTLLGHGLFEPDGSGTIGAAWADTLIDATESGTSDAVNVQGHEVALGSISTPLLGHLLGSEVFDQAATLPLLTGAGVFGDHVLGEFLVTPTLTGVAFFGLHSLGGYVVFATLEGAGVFGAHDIRKAGLRVPLLSGEGLLFAPTVYDADGMVLPALEGVGAFGAHKLRNSTLQLPLLTGAASFGAATLAHIALPVLIGVGEFPTGTLRVATVLGFTGPLVGRGVFGRHALLEVSEAGYGLYIAGVLKNSVWHSSAGINFTLALNGGSSMRFVVCDPTGAYVPTVGQQVRFQVGDSILFVGAIEQTVEVAQVDAADSIKITQVVANDWGAHLLGRRVVYGSAKGRNWDFLVRSLTIRYLEEEGVHYIGGLTGDEADYVIQPQSALELYNSAGSAAGKDWYMDPWLQVIFSDKADPNDAWLTEQGNFRSSFTEADVVADSIRVQRSSGEYRNQTYVTLSRADAAFVEPAVPNIPFDLLPSINTFSVAFPLDTKPNIVVFDDADIESPSTNSYTIPQSAIYDAFQDGYPSGSNPAKPKWEAVYFGGEQAITIDRIGAVDAALGAPVAAVQVSYQILEGASPFVVVSDPLGIGNRRGAEGRGTGKVDAVESQTDIETREAALALGASLNARYSDASDVPAQINFQYWALESDGYLRPGQAIDIAFSRPAIVGTFYVDGIDYEEVDGSLDSPQGPRLLLSVRGTTAAAAAKRPVQRVRMNRPTENAPWVFVLAKTQQGATNPGLVAGVVQPSHIIRQSGVLADAALYFETAPIGGGVTVEVQLAPATDPSTYATLAELTIPAGYTGTQTLILGADVSPNDRLRLNVSNVDATNAVADGLLTVRQFT